MMIKNLLVCIMFLLTSNIFASSIKENQLAVHLLSYLAQDYGEAVQGGEIVSQAEYQEQLDFSKEVIRISKENNYDNDLALSLVQLDKAIKGKEKANVILEKANSIKTNILKRYNLLTYPNSKIDLVRANSLFKQNCISCHGTNGQGDGKDGIGLEPKPTNFHDLERMQNVSPYGAFNTITLGVNETGMAAHDYLSEEDRWSLAYYVSSFRFQGIKKIDRISMTLKESSGLSDNEIKENFKIKDDDLIGVMASIRDVNSSPPSGKGQIKYHISKAVRDLNESLNLYKSGKIKEAKNIALEAYLQGVEPIEGLLRIQNRRLVIEIESDLSLYRSQINKNVSKEELQKILLPILSKLESFDQTVNDGNVYTAMALSFGIVLREAFEAGLILFLLFGLIRKSGTNKYNKYVHSGWLSSLILGLVLYVVIDNYFNITGKLTEAIEGYTAIIASALLFYVGYWLHKNTDIEGLKNKLTGAVNETLENGRGMTIFFIAFTAAFREVFETLLFLKILILDGHHSFYVATGAVFAIILTVLVIALALKFSLKINLKAMFSASTVLILSLSIIFLGKGIGALQKVGVFEQTTLGHFSFPTLGFNGTLEVLLAQILMILTIAIYLVTKKYKQVREMAI